MAQKLHSINQVVGSVKESVFISNEAQIVYLLIWNMDRLRSKIAINDEIIFLEDCGGNTENAHHVKELYMAEGDKIELQSDENLTYNIIK